MSDGKWEMGNGIQHTRMACLPYARGHGTTKLTHTYRTRSPPYLGRLFGESGTRLGNVHLHRSFIVGGVFGSLGLWMHGQPRGRPSCPRIRSHRSPLREQGLLSPGRHRMQGLLRERCGQLLAALASNTLICSSWCACSTGAHFQTIEEAIHRWRIH